MNRAWIFGHHADTHSPRGLELPVTSLDAGQGPGHPKVERGGVFQDKHTGF